MLRLSSVEIAFEGEPPILSDIDLALDAGSMIGLIGPPSSGKSLLLKAIAGLLRPRKGAISAFEHDLALAPEAELRRLRKRFGMVFQNNALFDSLTIFDNVAFPLLRSDSPPPAEEIASRVRARLADVGLAGTEELFPHALSGGMQKRAGIARATIHAPLLKLYDDPTAGLDPVTAARILVLIADLHARDASGVTVVVSNEMETLLRAMPRIVMLHRGRVVFDGASAEIDRSPLASAFARGDVGFEAEGRDDFDPRPERSAQRGATRPGSTGEA